MIKKCYMTLCVAFFAVAFGALFSHNASALSVSAKSAVLIEAATGKVLFSKNEREHLPMASTTKIMTALLTLESGGLDNEFTVDPDAVMVEGSSMGLQKGDIVTKRTLAYGMLLPSGNDAANAGAVAAAGSIDKFVELMNARAKQLGLSDTSFETPSGLDGENHYSTAYDMARLARAALSNSDFAKICATRTAKLSYGNPPYTRYLSNHNRLLREYDGAIGVKTGFTKKAGRCLVSAACRDGVTLVAVTLNAPSDWSDHKAMLDYGFTKVKTQNFSPNLSDIQIPVVGAKEYYVTVTAGNIAKVTFGEDYYEKLERKIIANNFLYAPIKSGDVVGTAEYLLDGVTVASVTLIADNDVDEYITEIKVESGEKISKFFKNIWYNVVNWFKRLKSLSF